MFYKHLFLKYLDLVAIFKTAGGIGMAGVIVSVISINILPYILVAVKSSFLNFDVSSIYKTIFTSLADELPPW